MSEPVLAIRDRLIDDLAYNDIGRGLEISLHEAADYGLMNGAMLVRAAGIHLELVKDEARGPVSTSPIQRKQLIRTSLSAANHIASFGDRHANGAMVEIFGGTFYDCLYLAKRVQRMGANPYDEEAYPRVIKQLDQTKADALDAHMAETGAKYLKTINGQLLITTEATGTPGRGCPLHYKRDAQPTELENVVVSLVDEYLDQSSVFYGKGYHGIANFVLLAASHGQPRNHAWNGKRIDWQLPDLPRQ